MTETDLPDYLADLFDASPEISDDVIKALEQAGQALVDDPAFQADYIKGDFILAIQAAMARERLTQTSVAARWGKTRQYLSKLLNEDKRVNFTLDTMVSLCMAVKRRLKVQVVNENEPSTFAIVRFPNIVCDAAFGDGYSPTDSSLSSHAIHYVQKTTADQKNRTDSYLPPVGQSRAERSA